MVQEILEETIFKRRRLSRLAAATGINYNVAISLVENGLLKLVEVEGKRTRGRKRKRPTVAVLTPEGKRFLQIFAELEELMPKEDVARS